MRRRQPKKRNRIIGKVKVNNNRRVIKKYRKTRRKKEEENNLKNKEQEREEKKGDTKVDEGLNKYGTENSLSRILTINLKLWIVRRVELRRKSNEITEADTSKKSSSNDKEKQRSKKDITDVASSNKEEAEGSQQERNNEARSNKRVDDLSKEKSQHVDGVPYIREPM
ncbi:vicilin-like seed storage protein [Capsicum galapagoense]